MKKLIGMTEFVLNNPTNFGMEIQSLTHQAHNRYISHLKHAKFLQQTPILGMFVPCDEDGNVLIKPSKEMWDKFINSELGSFEDSYTYCFEYQQAEQRVIFEGWLIQSKDNLQTIISDQNMDNIFLNIDGTIFYNNQPIKKIEDLVPYNLILK